ncbi:MAG: CHAT domain-containing protein [Saprospiraceae bacterium]|nr:CHAT domain-containing protein [Saprospiraceae bacterium]
MSILRQAENTFGTDRKASQLLFADVLKHISDARLYNYALFHIRLTDHFEGYFCQKTAAHMPDFKLSENDVLTDLLMTVDSVFLLESINGVRLAELSESFTEFPWIYGLSQMALGLHFKYYLHEHLTSLAYFNLAVNHLTKHPIGYTMTVYAIKESIQQAFHLREMLTAEASGQQALFYANFIPEDTISTVLSLVASGYSRVNDDTDFSKKQFRKAYELTKNSQYVFLHQEVLKYLSHYHFPEKSSDFELFLSLYKTSVHKYGDKMNLEKNLGQFEMMKNNPKAAIIHLEKALDYCNKLKRPDKAMKETILGYLKDACLSLGYFENAIVSSLAQINVSLSVPVCIECLYARFSDSLIQLPNAYIVANEMSQILRKRYHQKKNIEDLYIALKFSKLSIDYLALPHTTLEENKKITLVEYSKYIIDDCIELLYLLTTLTNEKQYLEDYLNYVEISKASILYGDDISLYQKYGIPDDIALKEYLIQEKIQHVQLNHSIRTDSLVVWQNELERIFQFYKFKYPDFFDEKLNKKKITIAEIQNRMGDCEAILSYNLTSDALFIFSITADNCKLIRKNIDSNLPEDIRKIQQTDFSESSLSKLKNGYTSLISEDLRAFDKLTIIPDGILNTISFEGLVSEFNENKVAYAIEKHNFSSIPSVMFYVNKSTNTYYFDHKSTAHFFAFSDPQTIKNQTGNIPELPGSYLECKSSASGFLNSKLYTGYQSTLPNFLKAYTDKSAQIVHLSVHGNAADQEKNNVLLLFRSKTKPNGIDTLFGYQLRKWRSPAKMIVLSACETGKGKILDQEGTFSIARAFIRNGAGIVISSLWKLDDVSTKTILKDFYKNSDIKDPSEKLRQAKLKYLRSGTYHHPFMWAGLVYSG